MQFIAALACAQRPVTMAFDYRALCVISRFERCFRWYFFPLGSDPPVQFVQYDIRKQRRQDSTLRRSLFGVRFFSVWHNNRCFQHFFENAQQFLVLDSQRPYLTYQFGVVDVIEEPFYIEVNDMVQMLYLYQPHTLRDCCFSGAVRAKAI